MKLIALTGPKQVGKSTVATAIADTLDAETHILSFADPMRAMLQAMGVDLLSLVDQSKKESPIAGIGKSPRHLMQTLGTDWGRGMIDENIWLWSMQHRIDIAKEQGAQVIVIDDCRFDNEADFITNQGGTVVLLRRDGIDYGSDSHASEQPIDFFKISICCDVEDENAASRIVSYEP
jgi:hypothetical protein